MCSTTPDSASWKLPHNFVLKIYLEHAQFQKTGISPSQKQRGLQAVAQHIQTFTCEDGVNALPDLLVHTDNWLAALSYTNPLHCNMSNRFQIKYMNKCITDCMRLKWSECEKAGFGSSKEADWLTNIHTYIPGTWTFSSIISIYFFALCGSFS